MVIDPGRHPLLHEVAQGAQWVGTDEFPSCIEWADEHEVWLRFLKAEGVFDRYLRRLRGPKEKRDEAFAEIAVAYFLVRHCGLTIFEWEPPGAGAKVGEFLVGFDPRAPIFVEVKSPGWEDEIAKAEGQGSPRLQQPKYITGDPRSTAPWASVRHAVRKAYPKMRDSMPTLVIINDDLMVSLPSWGKSIVDIALYTPRSPGHTSGYLVEDGPFATRDYERLGGVGVLEVRLRSRIEYRFELFENPHALPAVALPPKVGKGYPRYTVADVEPARVSGEELWFKRVLRDAEWLKDPWKKAREEAARHFAEWGRAEEPHLPVPRPDGSILVPTHRIGWGRIGRSIFWASAIITAGYVVMRLRRTVRNQ